MQPTNICPRRGVRYLIIVVSRWFGRRDRLTLDRDIKTNIAPEEEHLLSTEIALGITPVDLGSESKLRYWDLGPLLQGVIMEHIDPVYAEQMHADGFNPYSQYCALKEGQLVWVINSLTDSSYHSIVEPVLGAGNLCIKKLGIPLAPVKQSQICLSKQELIGLIYNSRQRKFVINFVSPTSFKSGGNYQIMPNMHLLYQNLIMHYGQVFDADQEVDPETVDYLAEHTRIVGYNLTSRYFHLSENSLPAFHGSMTIMLKGAQPLIGLAHMLLRFGTFGGVGIKTSMGMGGFSIE